MIHENWAYVGALIFVLGSFGYIRDTIRGKVKPNRVTWFIWALAPMIAFFAQLGEGVPLQESLLTFLAGFIPILVLIASFLNKKSYWKIGKLDIACGILSLIGLALWLITGTGIVAIIFALLADVLAALPTYIKAYRHPETENWVLYFSQVIGIVITFLTLTTWNFQTVAFPLYILFSSLLLTVLVKFKLGKR